MSLVLVTPLAAQASVAIVEDDTARVNGTVYAVAHVGDRTIIGGSFTAVGGQPRDHVAAIRADGTLDPTFKPDTDGTVYAVAGTPDGTTVFVGGAFSSAGGAPRANLAAVDGSTGAALADWTADTTGTYPDVLALAVSGTRVYAAGKFGGIDGTTRKRIAAIDIASGSVVKAFRPAPNLAAVRFLAVDPSGSRVFAGGAFDVIGGQSRPAHVAELYADTGMATPFSPTAVGSRVTAMGISPDAGTLYFGVADNRVFAYDVASSTQRWSVKNGGDTQAIAASNDEIWLGGHFGNSLTFKQKRQWILSLKPDGTLTGWNPNLGGGDMGVWALALTATSLLVGGEFVSVDGSTAHPRFAEFSGTP